MSADHGASSYPSEDRRNGDGDGDGRLPRLAEERPSWRTAYRSNGADRNEAPLRGPLRAARFRREPRGQVQTWSSDDDTAAKFNRQ